jgi:hypothetical protein
MRPAACALLVVLSACTQRFTDEQRSSCGGDLGKLRVGMLERVMLTCSFPGYSPYVSSQRTSSAGEIKIYRGMADPDYIVITNGKVSAWGNR